MVFSVHVSRAAGVQKMHVLLSDYFRLSALRSVDEKCGGVPRFPAR